MCSVYRPKTLYIGRTAFYHNRDARVECFGLFKKNVMYYYKTKLSFTAAT